MFCTHGIQECLLLQQAFLFSDPRAPAAYDEAE
jgi:hypothetical protein